MKENEKTVTKVEFEYVIIPSSRDTRRYTAKMDEELYLKIFKPVVSCSWDFNPKRS